MSDSYENYSAKRMAEIQERVKHLDNYAYAKTNYNSFQNTIQNLNGSTDVNAYKSALSELPRYKGFIDDKAYNQLSDYLSSNIKQIPLNNFSNNYKSWVNEINNTNDMELVKKRTAELAKQLETIKNDISYENYIAFRDEFVNTQTRARKRSEAVNDFKTSVDDALKADAVTSKDLLELLQAQQGGNDIVDDETVDKVKKNLLGESTGDYKTDNMAFLKSLRANAEENGDQKGVETWDKAIELKQFEIDKGRAKQLSEYYEIPVLDRQLKIFNEAFESNTNQTGVSGLDRSASDEFKKDFGAVAVPYFKMQEIRNKIKNGETLTETELKWALSGYCDNSYFGDKITLTKDDYYNLHKNHQKIFNENKSLQFSFDNYIKTITDTKAYANNGLILAEVYAKSESAGLELKALAADDFDKYANLGSDDEATEFMTATQKGVYNYYLGKGDEQSAYAYKRGIQEDINYREAKELVENAGFFTKTGVSFASGFEKFGQGLIGFVDMMTDNGIGVKAPQSHELKVALSTDSVISLATAEIIDGSGTWGKVWYSAMQSLGKEAPTLALSLANPSMGLSNSTMQVLQGSMMFASSSGASYTEALKENKTNNEAAVYAVINGALEVGLEKALGSMYGWSGGSKVATKLLSKMQNTLVNKGLSKVTMALLGTATYKISSMMSEGFEEYLQEVIDPIVRNFVYNEDNDISLFSEEAFISFASGALVSLLFGVSDIKSTYRQSLTGASIRSNTDGINGLIENARNALNNPEISVEIKQEISALLETIESKGNQATNIELGQLQELVQIGINQASSKQVEQAFNDLKNDIIEAKEMIQNAPDLSETASIDEELQSNLINDTYRTTSGDVFNSVIETKASNTATDVSGTDSANADFDTNIDTDIDTEVNVELSSDIDTITESEIAEADYLDNETLESVEENEYDKTIRLMDGRAKPLTEAQAYVQSVGRALGYNVVIDDLSRGGRTASGKSFKGTTRGFFDGQTIYLHEGQTTFDAVVEIFKHEITHYAELNPEMYNKYAKAVFDSKVFENWISGKGGFDQYSQSIIDKYKKHGVSLETEKKTDSPTKVEREIIAYFTSEMLFNEKGNTLERFINEVNSEDRNAISQFIHDFISWLKARLKGEKVSIKIVKLENRFAAVLRNVDTNAQKNNTTNDGDVQYEFNDGVNSQSKAIIREIKDNISKIPTTNIFNVYSEEVPNNIKKSQYVLDIFNSQGGRANNSLLGEVELARAGAKSTMLHGFGKNKLAAVKAIKNVIENGTSIGYYPNYENSGVDRYIFAAKGQIDGKDAFVGVVVKAYPQNKNSKAKFYLHEALTTETDSPIMTAPQLSVDTVSESVSNPNVSQDTPKVNTHYTQESENYSSPEQDNDGNSYSFEITPEQDAEYLDAVNNGDMETAQRMVDEAARNNGYDLKLYHGTKDFGFTKFSTEKSIDGFTIFTSESLETAEVYSKTQGVRRIAEGSNSKQGNYALYGKSGNLLEVDAQDAEWNRIPTPNIVTDDMWQMLGYMKTHDIAQFAKDNNYDGVKINNVVDGGTKASNVVVHFDSSSLKSADPVTYDDNGNVIPLSERFNEDDNDIRYSFEDDVADEVSSLTEQYKNGEISYDEWKSQAASLIGDNNTNKADNPVSIANLSVEAANPTPDLPKRNRANKKGDGDSKLAESIQKSDIFSKEFKDEVVDDDFIKHYDRATNKETMAKAKKLLDEGGSSFVLQWFNKSIDETSTVDVAAGIIMLDRYQKIGDMANALEIAYKLREMATISGQTVQIFSILGRFTPEMMLVYTQHELDKAYETIIKGKTNKWIESNRSKFELTEAEKEFIIRNTLVASTLPEGRDKQIKLAEIATLVQKKIPHKPGDAYKALQRICMLLNPKTNVRNIVGNAIMTPICWIDDLWGACIDNLASKKSGVRTTGNFQFGKETAKAFAQGVYESYDDFIRDINTREINLENSSLGSGNNFNENHTGKVSKYINPISKSLNALDRVTSFILDAGDRGFFQMWFINSLNNQLRLNNATEPTAEMIEIATNDALERTWQDSDNKIVQAFSGMRGALNHLNIHGVGLGDLFIKFIKTPSNLLRASIKYSPAGFVKATSDYIKFNRSLKNGQFDAKLQIKFVKNLSKSITGTLLYVVFGFLAHAGVISGGADDDKDVAAFEKNILGVQPYSVKIGDYSFSYEWAQPIASGMAFMADLMNIWESDSRTEAEADLENALLHGSQTILNLSVFQSFQNIFKEEDLISTIINGIVNEVVVFSPQALSQVASVTDDYSRETYEKDNKIQTVINSVKKKIPGLRNTLPESVDVYGETVENPYDNVWDAFFNPANQLQSNSSPSAEKIYELYQNTKDKSIIPPKAINEITINGEDITFTSEERTAFQKYRGQLNAKYLDDFTSSSLWEKSSDEEKISIIKDIYSFTNSLAKNHYSSEYELSKKEQKILEYEDFGIMSPIEYFSITTTADKDGNSYVSKSEYAEAVNNTDMSQKQKDLLIGLNEVEGKSDYSKNKTKGFGAGDWYYKENGQYVKITSAAELNRLRRNNVDTYVYTGNYTDVIDELWRAYRGY